jgi:serine/threonine protein kinase/WD40 repeat protein
MSPRVAASRVLRAECAELARRVHGGGERAAEDLFREQPDLAADPDVALELIYAEVVAREEAGRPLPRAAWLDRFPQYADRLGRLFDLHTAISRAAASASVGPGSTFNDGHPRSALLPVETGFELLEEIGRGANGVVFKARQPGLNRTVAVKVLRAGEFAGPDEEARLLAEAKTVARLQHPNIVQVFEVGTRDGRPYLILEYVAGGSLADRLRHGPLPARDAAALIATLARAVQHAHDHSVIHRDLKPGNVLLGGEVVRPCGDEDAGYGFTTSPHHHIITPKVTDFGLAKQADAGTQTRTGTVLGTPGYMAPEQATGTSVGPAADVYGLGAVLYECLTGRLPFQAATALDTLDQVRTADPVSPRLVNPAVPRDLDTICLACLRKEPASRYGSAAALADDLDRFGRGEPVRVRPIGVMSRGWNWAKRRPAVAGLMAAVVLLVATGVPALAVLWWQAAAGRDAARSHSAARSIALARTAWTTDDFKLARTALAECPSELRDAEWAFIDRSCRAERPPLEGHRQTVIAVAFSPDGRRLATLSLARELICWDVETGQPYGRWMTQAYVPGRVAFGPGGDILYLFGRTAPSDVTAAVCVDAVDPATGNQRRCWTHSGMADTFGFSPDGTSAVASDRATAAVLRIDLATGRTVMTVPGPPKGGVHAVDCSGSGRRVAYSWVQMNTATVVILNGNTGQTVSTIRHTTDLGAAAVCLSPDGRRVAVADNFGDRPSEVAIYDTDTGVEERRISCRLEVVRTLAFSPDGRYLAAASPQDRTAVVWEWASGEEAVVLRGHRRGIMHLAFAPDGRHVATGSQDRTARLWNFEVGP